MKILVTGSAGFIGSFLCQQLIKRGDEVVGIDNHNDYYDPKLKLDRLDLFINEPNYSHFQCDISDKTSVHSIFKRVNPDKVVNLAAQAGVRYSMENPYSYIDSNVVGFMNILEACRHHEIEHLVYASSSSVYGANTKMPFATSDNVDHPLSLYAATKKANELMAHTYSNLYNLPSTGLRFFTVYGPWGRPDMALFMFTKSIIEGLPIKVFNYGKHRRDFTYINDIVEGIKRVLDKPPSKNDTWDRNNPDPSSSFSPWRVYNIGNNNPVELLDYIGAIENSLGIEAKKELVPLQPGDVPDTYADVSDLETEFKFKPTTSIEEGVSNFVNWYRNYYKILK
jgi:UDP-glucuronate 4-epimerase